MTMSPMPTPPPPLYIMMSCGCRGMVEHTTAQSNLVLMCPRHRTQESYVIEQALHMPMSYRLNPLRLFRWLGRKPNTPKQAALKLLVCFGIGYATFSVVYYALRGLEHDRRRAHQDHSR
jgi:hypothetical protein